MRFAFYSGLTSAPWGGSEELWSRAAMHLVKSGHEVSASIHYWAHQGRHVTALEKAGVQIDQRMSPRSQSILGRGWRKLNRMLFNQIDSYDLKAKFAREVSSFKPDLVVVSQGGISDGLLALEAAYDNHTKYVNLMQANSESYWPSDNLIDRLLLVAESATYNYFVSKANAELFSRQIGIKLSNIDYVYNPSNQNITGLIDWPQVEDELSLACVARLDAVAKGQDILLEVLARPQWRDRPVRVHFYGKGCNDRSLQRLAHTLGVSEKVVFEGHVDDIPALWARHHALVLPSRYEGTPLSLIEAMRCGRPSIATAVAGIPELVQDGVNGFLAEAPTIPLLEQCMERVWNQRGDLKKMGEAASKYIKNSVPEKPVEFFVSKLIEAASK